jgi:hypothetical protein
MAWSYTSILPEDYMTLLLSSTSTNLVTYVNFISPLFGFERQADTIYFDLSNAFDFDPHFFFLLLLLLLHKLSAFGLSGDYVNWFRSYLPTGNFRSVILVFSPHLLNFFAVFRRYLSWYFYSSVCLLTTYAMQLLTLSIYFCWRYQNLPSSSKLLSTSVWH